MRRHRALVYDIIHVLGSRVQGAGENGAGRLIMEEGAAPSLSPFTLSWMLAPSTLSEAMTPASQGMPVVEIWLLVQRK